VSLFDPAIFDPAIFDTGNTVTSPTKGGWKKKSATATQWGATPGKGGAWSS
jgi:hypothetical protein